MSGRTESDISVLHSTKRVVDKFFNQNLVMSVEMANLMKLKILLT